jgi:hypothetical protein
MGKIIPEWDLNDIGPFCYEHFLLKTVSKGIDRYSQCVYNINMELHKIIYNAIRKFGYILRRNYYGQKINTAWE